MMLETVGRYEIVAEIGQGGFAIVYRARDTELDRLVALKELRPILLNDKDWVKRFRREAKTFARLDHPHIVTIHDVYEIDNRLFIVMRLVNGPSLDNLIASKRHLSWSEASEIITAVTTGLSHAHARDILHRDLKPANILMDPERGPMLTDFGLAKLAGESSMSMTASGGVVGTPHYIAPEVWEGQGTTRQSDIYALGCIFYEMLTGEKIFKGETPPAVMMAHFKPPALPQVWPEGVPAGVSDVLKITLASKPADRYATVDDLARALIALPETAPEGGADVVSEQRDDDSLLEVEPAQVVELPQEPEAISMETDLKSLERPPSQQQSLASDTPHLTTPSQPLPKRETFSIQSGFQKLEDTIADLPPKWHSFLKSVSVYVIIVFMLAIVNLLISSYPWFIWVALAVGIPLAIRFVNLLFDEENKPISSPPPVSQAVTPPPSGSTARTTPLPDQEASLDSSTSDVQAVTSSPSGSTATTTPFPTQETPLPPPASGIQPATSPPITSTSPSSVAPTPSQVVRARQQRKRSGCLWISVILGGIFLVTIIGLGGFCSVFGSLLNSAMPTVELGSTLTQNIDVPLPDSSDTPNLNLEIVGGELLIAPGAEILAEGRITYNVALLEPQIIAEDNEVRIQPKGDIGLGSFTTEGLENIWDLKLGSVPMALTINADGANAEVELGGLSLVDLIIAQGGANFRLSFSEPNLSKMKNLKFTGGASMSTLAGLANARAENITFEAGAGDFTLDFSGELQNDIDVNINGGFGAITIIIPENIAAQVSMSGPLSDVDATGAWQKSDEKKYILPGEGHKITIKADIGLGTLKLRTP